MTTTKTWNTLARFVIAMALLSAVCLSQQIADPNFDTKVAHPAYSKGTSPRVLFDEAHNNFHTASGRYRPFAELMKHDGYHIDSNHKKLLRDTLNGYNILIIANAMGAARQIFPDASKPAFTDEECDAIRDWVNAGGSLLLIADHAPFGAAAERLAGRFGVDMSKGHTTDPAHHDLETGNLGFLIFTRDNNLLSDCPITRGRTPDERVNSVMTFTGQSLKGPPGSTIILKLASSAVDIKPPIEEGRDDGRPVDHPNDSNVSQTPAQSSTRRRAATSAAGRAQGISFEFGKGRVVVLGEAAMLSAQISRGPGARLAGKDEIRMGMNRSGIDNRQLALNIMHWLSRLLS